MSESQHKESNAAFRRSPTVNEWRKEVIGWFFFSLMSVPWVSWGLWHCWTFDDRNGVWSVKAGDTCPPKILFQNKCRKETETNWLRAYSIIESRFGFTLNLVSDSVKKCIRITNPNLDSDSVKPVCNCRSISIECLIIDTGSWSVTWRHKHVIKLSQKHTNHNIYCQKKKNLTLQTKNNFQNNINQHQWRHARHSHWSKVIRFAKWIWNEIQCASESGFYNRIRPNIDACGQRPSERW